VPTLNDVSVRAVELLRRLGLPGVILLSALAVDTGIVLMAGFDDIGPRGKDLLLLPGIAGMVACALWARARPAVAAFAGAAVLCASTALIRAYDVSPYSTVLMNLSLAEIVAGVELVVLCVRRAHPGVAFAATGSLAATCCMALTERTSWTHHDDRGLVMSLMIGTALLAGAVAIGIRGRQRRPRQPAGPLADLVRGQWPLIGVLSLLLFIELSTALQTGPEAVPSVLCSAGVAAMAVLAPRYPRPAPLVTTGLLAVSAIALQLLDPPSGYAQVGGVTLGQAGAVVVLVVFLVRSQPPARAVRGIGLLTAVVAVSSVAAARRGSRDYFSVLGTWFTGAVLILGIAVALGLYFRSRDSERTQGVRSAVTEAQTAERMALARELHDVVAHHVTGIVVQAQAAQVLGGKDPEVALAAMARIEEAGTAALVAMRRLVGSMRGDAPAGTTEFSEQATTDLEADLRRLVGAANHGVPTDTTLDLPEDIPQEVARSALRLMQESLTNIGKHAPGARAASVSARVATGSLHLRVHNEGGHDDGRPPAGGSSGYGLIGMRERVALLHGELTAGPVPGGGWLVEAWLPLEGDS
jgi:signal transduction histidine kinase